MGLAGTAHAQPTQPLYVIDKPTAGVLDHKSYLGRGRTGPESSFLVSGALGLSGRFQFGLSYGMQRVFEHGEPTFNSRPGVQMRLRIVDEGTVPAIAIGFDSQGHGEYHSAVDRYDRKSLGLYAVASKNFMFFAGDISLHGGANYSFESTADNRPNVFGAVDWTMFGRLSVLMDADAGLNDNSGDEFGGGGVYVDAGVRWYIGDVVSLSLMFRDLTGNFSSQSGIGREFEFAFIQSL